MEDNVNKDVLNETTIQSSPPTDFFLERFLKHPNSSKTFLPSSPSHHQKAFQKKAPKTIFPSSKNTTAAKLSHVSHGVLFFIPRCTELGAPIGCCKGGTYDNEVPASTWSGKPWKPKKSSALFGDSGFLKKNKSHSTKKKGPLQTNMWGQKLLFYSFPGAKHVWCNMFLLFWTDHGLGEADGPPAVSLLRVHMTWDGFWWIVSVDVFSFRNFWFKLLKKTWKTSEKNLNVYRYKYRCLINM